LVLLLLLLSLLGTVLIGEQYATVGESCPDKTVNLTCFNGSALGVHAQHIEIGGDGVKRDYSGEAPPNRGGPCIDGWWLLINPHDTEVQVNTCHLVPAF